MRRAVCLRPRCRPCLLGCTAAPEPPAPTPPTGASDRPHGLRHAEPHSDADSPPPLPPDRVTVHHPPAAAGALRRPPGAARHRSPGSGHRAARGDLAQLRRGGRLGGAPARGSGVPGAPDHGHGAGGELLGHPGPARHLGQRDRGATGVRPAVPARGGRRAPGHGAGGARARRTTPPGWRCCSSWPASRPPGRRRCRSSSSPSGRRSRAAPVTRCTTSAPGSWWPTCPGRAPGGRGHGVAGPGRRTRRLSCRSAGAATMARGCGRRCGRRDGMPGSPPGPARTGPATTGRTRRRACRRSGSAASRTRATTPARDVPSVVSRVQLDRVGRLVWAWLN